MDYKNFTITRDNDIVTVTIDVPERPHNVFDETVMSELNELVTKLQTDKDAKAVVFRSGKPSGFLAGADVSKIAAVTDADEIERFIKAGQDTFDRVAALPMPTIAVIHGPCLGGGMEFALACDYRIARDDSSTRLGLPETLLGILPAWGGTQRMPRTVGLVKALELVLAGKKLSASKALRMGLVDLAPSAEDFEQAIADFVKQPKSVNDHKKPKLLSRLLNGTRVGRWLVFRTAKKKLAKTARHYPAPAEALEAMRRGMQQSMRAGLDYEREAIGRLLFTPTCRSLLNLFFRREQAKKTATWVSKEAAEQAMAVETVGVVGGGVMGAGIAQLAAYQGKKVILKEINDKLVSAGEQRIRSLFADAVKGGRLREEEANTRLAGVTGTTEWEPFADADVVVEAVVERPDVKAEVFGELDNITRPDALLTTNTSSLPVELVADATSRPQQVAGLHFFNPVHRMELVEVVRAAGTSEAAIATLVKLVKQLGKTPIVVKDSPGFLVNRILFPYLAEGVRLWDEGADTVTVDKVMKRFGMPMGPLELLDQVGLDVAAHVAKTLHQADGDPTAARLNQLVESGRLGRKSGGGFYEYENGKKQGPAEIATRRVTEASISEDHIEERLVMQLINESARCLGEEIVTDAWMVDLAMVLGTGFAPFRGGPLRVADEMELTKVIETMQRLEKQCGSRFAPSTTLMRHAEQGTTFHGDAVSREAKSVEPSSSTS